MSAKTFIIRASVLGAAVVSLALYDWLGFESFRWLGLVLYISTTSVPCSSSPTRPG